MTVVAFSDFQCPFCSRAVPTMKQIEDTYKGKVRIAFKHLPLSFHQNAQIAAEASMAANEQGKFWEMHDKLFANQQQLDRPSLEKYAQELGLNMAKFKAALDSGKFKKQVQEDAADGRQGGRHRHADLLRQRQVAGGRSALRRLQAADRRRAGGQEVSQNQKRWLGMSLRSRRSTCVPTPHISFSSSSAASPW